MASGVVCAASRRSATVRPGPGGACERTRGRGWARRAAGEAKFFGKLAERRGGDGDMESDAMMMPTLLEPVLEAFSFFLPME